MDTNTEKFISICKYWKDGLADFCEVVEAGIALGLDLQMLVARTGVSKQIIIKWAAGHGEPNQNIQKIVVSFFEDSLKS